MLAAGPRMIELAGEVADGALLMVGLDPAGIRAARSHLEVGARRAGRSLGDFPVVFVVTIALGSDADAGTRWVRSWFAPGATVPCLSERRQPPLARGGGLSARGQPRSRGHTEDQARRIADAFGLFGSPERCAERLMRARDEAGVEQVFLFPAHDLAGGYDMPEAVLEAFERVIRPRL
jgi:5,10-methylenetetrahydromethanopterin reductase